MDLRSASAARPELAADRAAVTAPFDELMHGLGEVLGKKLAAYLAGALNTDRDPDGDAPATERLRRPYIVALMLRSRDFPSVVQAWFTGLNPELDDRSPIRILTEGTEDEARAVLGAARLFLAVG